MLKRTPFYEFHIAAGAKLVDFAGWEMPLLYRGIVAEHEQTRHSGSVFDVSHMGRLQLTGAGTAVFLNHVLTRNVADQRVGQSRYSLVCNTTGGVLDDVIVSRDEKRWIVVCNASNREKIMRHFEQVRAEGAFDVTIADQTESTAMLAIQGPKVIDRLNEELSIDLRAIKRYHFETTEVMLTRFQVFRSGYTGEDGVELILPAKMASMAMRLAGDRLDTSDAVLKPAGLGARDTLRLEAGMPLYGHELGESIDPISADLGWAVDLAKDFIGADALRVIQQRGPSRRLVGLELEGQRIARQTAAVTSGSAIVGHVTSGTLGPTLHKSIAMAYVDASVAGERTMLSVDLKGTPVPARVVKLPFYKRRN